jgi:CBS domain containing-hemolysin-like protein
MAGVVDVLSEAAMSRLHLVIALFFLLLLVFFGALADLVGTAVTAAEEQPFHAMAAKKLHGARQGMWLIRNADRVANVLNDIVGDIAGTVSGAAAVTVMLQLASAFEHLPSGLFRLVGVGLVTALTVGGKSYAKGWAVQSPERIVFQAGRLLWAVEHYLKIPITHRRRNGRDRRKER